MGYIHQVMNDEHRRLKALSQKYQDKIESFPKGTVAVKTRKDRKYLYLARRKDGKVKFDYIGPVSSEKAQKVLAQVDERKHYETRLKQVNHDLKDIGKIIRGRKASGTRRLCPP